jgi:hypothetical protein
MAGALDRPRQHALVLCTGSGLSSGTNFPLLRDVALQQIQVLIIDLFDLLGAELALSAPSSKSPTGP